VRDATGNQRLYTPFISQPNPLPEESTFTVVNNGLVDEDPPELTLIDILPVAVDITDSAKEITITLNLEDDVSGFRDILLSFYNPNGQEDTSFLQVLGAGDRIGGTELQGTYQVTVPIPQGTMTGGWEVRTLLRDRTGGETRYGTGANPYPQGPSDARFSVSTGGGTGSSYQHFTTLYGLSGNDALATADPDGDGFNNATELVLGTHPGDATSNGFGKITVTRDATHLHLSFTIDATLDIATDGDFLELGDGTPPFRVTGQVQGDPGGNAWINVLPVQVSGQTYRVSLPFSSGPTGCIRLLFEEG
jgi:hypothetical protein